MLNKMTTNMARLYYSDKPHDEDDVEIYAYGLERLISTYAQVAFYLVFGLIIGQLLNTIVFLSTYVWLRNSIGGFHAKTHLRCFLSFFAVYLVYLAVIFLVPTELIGVLSLSLTAISFLPILLYAPLDDVNRPASDTKKRNHRRQSLIKYAIQATAIIALALSGVLRNIEFLSPYLLLSLAFGQFSAVALLIVGKIKSIQEPCVSEVRG